jgi:hypothetical protein
MNLSWEMVTSRPIEAGGCLVCLPLEHLSLLQFEELMNELTNYEHFIQGDNSFDNKNACGYLLEEIPPSERSNAFVNVTVLLVFGQSGSKKEGLYFFQPKRFPYPQERTPKSGKFIAGKQTYVLEIGGVKFITAICFDLIAQPPGEGLFLSNLIQEWRKTKFTNIDYGICAKLPPCCRGSLACRRWLNLRNGYRRTWTGGTPIAHHTPNSPNKKEGV